MNAAARFDFERPDSMNALAGLLARLASEGRDYALAAGTTDLMPQIKHGLRTPEVLVSLNGLSELATIEPRDNGGCTIGALARLADVALDPHLRQHFPALAEAAGRVASPPIRQRATLGGNLLVDNRCIYHNQGELNRLAHADCFKSGGDVCHLVKSARRGELPQCQARFVSDTAPVLLLHDAVLRLVSPRGQRRIPLAAFYLDDGIERHVLAVDEVLTAIELPPADQLRVDYDKLTIRRALDFPSLGIALGLREPADGAAVELRVAMTGIGTRPGHWRFRATEHGAPTAMLDAACRAARSFSATYDQDFFPRDYRKRMIEVFIRRAAGRLGGQAWT
jgi:4-hydroxybenzoyl-CoA reductase subunit beta